MSAFLTPYRAELVEVRGDVEWWRLLEPLSYESDFAGEVITVPVGYAHDGESIPRRVAGITGGQPCRRAGVVHDYLYDAHALGGRSIDRDYADQVYEEACIVEGLDPVYARQRYNAVHAYAARHWRTL
jgi:Protein of unknown function (DUF1353)